MKKYINTGELAGLTGCLDEEIRELAKNGVLPAHKTRKGHWRFNVDAAEKYFGIQINKPEEDSVERIHGDCPPVRSDNKLKGLLRTTRSWPFNYDRWKIDEG